jgi:hypothetical protein
MTVSGSAILTFPFALRTKKHASRRNFPPPVGSIKHLEAPNGGSLATALCGSALRLLKEKPPEGGSQPRASWIGPIRPQLIVSQAAINAGCNFRR